MKNTLLVLLLAISLSATAQNDRLTAEKLWELGRVSLEDVSPDGKTVLYGVRYYDIQANKGSTDLYIVPTAGGTAKKLTAYAGSEYNAKYRPDGERIAFLRGGQLWEMNADGTDQHQVSEEEMNGFSWSPTGKHILFIRDVKYDQTANELYKDLPLADARIIDGLMYRHWNQWHDYSCSNIFYMAYEDGQLTGSATNIMKEPYDSPVNPFGGMEQIAWSANGKAIAYTCKKESPTQWAQSTNNDLYLYELASGKTRNLSQGMPGYDQEPVFSPDGRYLLWSSMERAGFESDRNRVFCYDLQKQTKEELTVGLERNVSHPHWSADSKTLYFSSGVEATYQLFAMDFASRKIRQITKGVHNYYSFLPAAGNSLVASRASMSMPHELYRVDTGSGAAEPITFINKEALSKIKMGEVKERWVETTDGKQMKVWMIYPPDFDPNKKYPALLYCQGGPQSAVSQFWSYRWNFQMMAANDYIIVAPNRRGLPSFGREWNDQISGDWGGQAMQDYFSAIDEAKQEPYIDEERLGAVGASYGGYSVYWLAGNHNKRFKAFISHCGLFNLESWYGTTEELFFANWDIKGPYWQKDQPISYEKHSPHKYVRNWDTPMLVIHGEKDFRVPIGEGMQAFQAAQLQGIPSRFLYFPEEGHWVSSAQNGILWQRVFFDWLDTYLKEEKQP
ncbi:MAG: S9 family peptidase [Bacteroidota bacterium]